MKKHESDYYVVKEFTYYATNSNINFYEVKFYNHKNKKLKVNFVIISMIQYHDCHQIFNFRNSLFHHLCSEKVKITHCLTDKMLQWTVMLTKSMIMVVKSIIMLVKSSDELSKVMLTSNFIKDTETDYDFCNWHYIMIKVQLLNEVTAKSICLNIECFVILLDRTFFKSQCSKVKIHTMTTLISV